MALTTSKLTEFPLRSTIPLSSHSPAWFFCFGSPSRRPSLSLLFKPLSSLRSTTTTNRKLNPSKNPNPDTVNSKPPSAPWLAKWPSPKSHPESSKRPTVSKRDNRNFDGRSSSGSGTSAMERIVLRLRNLGLGSDDEEGEEEEEEEDENSPMQVTGEEKLGDLLRRDWVRPDKVLEEENDEDDTVLPWERIEVEAEEMIQGKEVKKRTVKAPTLAELTMEDSELRRLRSLGMTIRERISVAKAGVTGAILEKIHETWRRSELVRLKFHESLAHDMKTAHELVERRSGGLVIWRAGSVMVVYRGSNYEGPRIKPQATDRDNFVPDVSSSDILIAKNDNGSTSTLEKSKHAFSPRVESMTEEEAEYNSLLDGLGPRFEDWWGTGVLPVDADLLPQTIPGFKTPLRLLPTGMRSRLTNAELTSLRKLAKSLPCHFALGRNRNHQGLAAAIVKLWEKSLVVKIAVKRGIQNTNNKLMAEEIKNLTGGLLLLRNKYFIIIYRGKDFIPTSVAAALAERQEITKQIQDVEEKVRRGPTEAQIVTEDGGARAGTLAEFYEAQAQWGREISSEEREKMIEEASRAKTAKVVRRLEHKLAIAQARKGKAEKLLRKIVASWVPVGPSDDQETITDEERVMYRRVGLRMKAYLPLGIRGVFDGVIENMHLHWKHRELVKLISKEKELAFVEETARLLEYESGGILVAIERVSKGFTLIYYRGKNYRRPISLRPRNLLTKAKALKRRVALQRYEALSQHISELEQTVEQMKKEIGDSKGMDGRDTCNLVGDGTLNHHSDSTEIEDEASWMDSDDDDDGEDFDYEDSNASESSMFEDDDFASNIKV